MPLGDLRRRCLHPFALPGGTYQALRMTTRWYLVTLPRISNSATPQLLTSDASSPEQHGSNILVVLAKFGPSTGTPTFAQDTCRSPSLHRKPPKELPWHRTQSPRSVAADQAAQSRCRVSCLELVGCSWRLGGDAHKVSSTPYRQALGALLGGDGPFATIGTKIHSSPSIEEVQPQHSRTGYKRAG